MVFPKWTVIGLALGVSAAAATPVGAKPGEPGAPAHDDDKREHGRREHDKDHDRDHDKDDEHRGIHGRSDDVRDGGRDKDDDRSAGEHMEFRRKLFERREKEIVDALNRDRRELNDEVRESVRKHWRNLARLVRVRELAAIAKEQAFVERVDRDIEREEKAFSARLEKLHGQAVEAGGAR